MEQYKDEIRSTRKGALGSSDGKLLMRIAMRGEVPQSAYKRLAVCKGLTEQQEIPYTAAVRTGDEIEMAIFDMLRSSDSRYQSNPCLTSEKYSRKNVRLISHIDFMLQDDDKKILYMYECKASKYTTETVRRQYKEQLYVHYLCGSEYAAKLGKGWKMKLFLCHYNTDGLDLENGVEFDSERLSVVPVRMEKNYFDMGLAMDVIDNFLEGFTEYYGDGEDVNRDLLPANVKQQFENISNTLAEIKEKEVLVDEFKQRLYAFMSEKGIKSVKSDSFSIVRVDPTVQHSFDHKKFLEDERTKHPRKTKVLEKKYDKTTNKKGYAKITLNNNNK